MDPPSVSTFHRSQLLDRESVVEMSSGKAGLWPPWQPWQPYPSHRRGTGQPAGWTLLFPAGIPRGPAFRPGVRGRRMTANRWVSPVLLTAVLTTLPACVTTFVNDPAHTTA